MSKARLDALVAEATTDAYNDSEQVVGLLTLIEDNLSTPFETELLGVNVTVERVDLTEGNEIVAICRRGSRKLKVPVLDLPLPSPPPAGAEWIAAYRYWRTGHGTWAGLRYAASAPSSITTPTNSHRHWYIKRGQITRWGSTLATDETLLVPV